jgi:glucose/arabinose dehydrogenase
MRTAGFRLSGVVFTVVSFLVSSAAYGQLYDVAWTLGDIGSAGYKLDAFEPAGANLGIVGATNPTLTLQMGQRYQATVVNYTVHPLEIIGKAASSSQDKVLLSMGAFAGTLESDPDVKWEDTGQGTVRFTLTQRLYHAMIDGGRTPGYRCRIHATTMRGDFAIPSNPPLAARIGGSAVQIELQTIASGLASPVDLQPDPSQADRLYVVDQAGVIYVIEQGKLRPEPFLDVRTLLVQPLGILGSHDVSDYDERGLLGFALHPKFADPNSPGFHRVYTYMSQPLGGPADFTIDMGGDAPDHQNVLTEWQVTADLSRVDPNSARELMRIDHPEFNHDGGTLAFGPDGYLYLGIGDGGNANDAGPGHGATGNGQNLHVVQGKILRIDPLAPELTPRSRDLASNNGAYRVPWDNPFVGVDGLDEIYAYGFRNPYRFSFDKVSGMLVVADVGQDHVEEIDVVRKGCDYGWNLKEGTFLFDPTGATLGLPLNDPNLIDPVAEYDHDDGTAIVGGYIYYGTEVPVLRALYVCGDFSLGFTAPGGRLFVADLWTGSIEELSIPSRPDGLGLFLKGIGQDNSGEVYVLASSALGPYGTTGVVMKMVKVGTGPAGR